MNNDANNQSSGNNFAWKNGRHTLNEATFIYSFELNHVSYDTDTLK